MAQIGWQAQSGPTLPSKKEKETGISNQKEQKKVPFIKMNCNNCAALSIIFEYVRVKIMNFCVLSVHLIWFHGSTCLPLKRNMMLVQPLCFSCYIFMWTVMCQTYPDVFGSQGKEFWSPCHNPKIFTIFSWEESLILYSIRIDTTCIIICFDHNNASCVLQMTNVMSIMHQTVA